MTTLFLNRELSVLAFNQRVFAQAENPEFPLLERLKFLFIVAANLDEFFEIRVAGLKKKQQLHHEERSSSGESISETLEEISRTAHLLSEKIYALLNEELIPALKRESIEFLSSEDWTPDMKSWVKTQFDETIYPVLSPVGLDFAHPFPRLVNKSLNFIVSLEGKDAFGRDSGMALVHAPRALPRVLKVPDHLAIGKYDFIFLTSVISAHSDKLFPGMKVTGCYQFRLTRNSDVLMEGEPKGDLADSLQKRLWLRHYGNVARLEIDARCPQHIADYLLARHYLSKEDLYRCHGPVNLTRYMSILEMIQRPDLRFSTITPGIPQGCSGAISIFSAIKSRDILLHHPYESFEPVLTFVRQAAIDPQVIAIKQTLYRTGHGSPMVKALIEAARAGKEVTAVIELQARFDEKSNLTLANHLQEAGALVIYGVIGFKTHAKMTLIVRNEGENLIRYAHLGTGNYHYHTTRSYTDFGLLTCNNSLTEDVQNLFHLLTGMGKGYPILKLLYAPFTLFPGLIALIDTETAHAKAGNTAHIIIKVNGLSDKGIISALYHASQSGVKIELIVRGICCLRPGMPGISENIRVKSIVGRFLEHSRIYYFYNNGSEKIFCSSADLMERNLHYRVEVCFPIEDPLLAARVKEEGLMTYLDDKQQSWVLDRDGNYTYIGSHKKSKRKGAAAQILLLNQLSEK